MDDMDYYEWEASKKRFTVPKIIKFIFKLIAGIIIVGTFVLLIGRIQLMKLPSAYTGITLTDGIAATVSDGSFDAIHHEPYENFDEDGYYHISNVILSKAASEVQFTVRYNSRSTINTLMTKYALAERPKGEVFIYILSDNEGNTYTSYVFAAASRPLYEFRRVVFTGVDLTNADTLYLDVYYGDDVSDDGLMNASFVIYDSEYDSELIDADDVKNSNLTFADAPVYISRLGENK